MTANSPAETRREKKRPWFRLHWLSWIVLSAMTAGMTIIVVPGHSGQSIEFERRLVSAPLESQPVWSDYDFISVSTWSHGWPFEYLRRPYSEQGFLIHFEGCPILWTSPRAWQMSGKSYAFSTLNLAANLLIGAVIVFIAVAGCEIWRRRRGGFRFSLLDLGTFTAFGCAILGWWQYHARAHAKEQAIKSAMMARGSLIDLSKGGPLRAHAASDYHGPDWLMRLLGNPWFLPFCFHIDRLHLDSTLLSEDDYADIPKLTYVDTVHCRLNPELAKSLAALRELRTVDGRIYAFGGGVPYRDRMVTSSNVQLLTQLPRVTDLYLGYSQLVPADLAVVARMPRLKLLQITGDDLLVEDLKPIVNCPTLQTLYLDISATEEERRAFTKEHAHLKVSWGDPQRWVGFSESNLVTDPWNVASVLFKRWQAEDGVQQPTTLFRGSLDFSSIRLTAERLKRLPKNRFPEVTDVSIGAADKPETAMELIRRCGQLESLDTRHVPLTTRDILSISFSEEPDLHLLQGRNTVQEFCDLARQLKPISLAIYASTFNNKEVKRIADATQGMAEVFSGLQYEEDERIRASDEL